MTDAMAEFKESNQTIQEITKVRRVNGDLYITVIVMGEEYEFKCRTSVERGMKVFIDSKGKDIICGNSPYEKCKIV